MSRPTPATALIPERLRNRLADSLIQQTSFPDLARWEDSAEKIVAASASVAALLAYRETQKTQAATARERAEARKRAEEIQAEIIARETDLSKLEKRLGELSTTLGTSAAGYAFQEWFYELVDYFEVPNRRPYVMDGRQIDGSVTVDGTTYLVELKFTKEQAGAPDIDTFHKKVSGKADNTMGIMCSISSYSSVAMQEASGPKGLLLPFGYQHLYLLLRGGWSFEDLVKRVRRHASQTGEAYLNAADFNH